MEINRFMCLDGQEAGVTGWGHKGTPRQEFSLSGLACGDGTDGFSRHQELSQVLARPIKGAFVRQEEWSGVPFNFKGRKKKVLF